MNLKALSNIAHNGVEYTANETLEVENEKQAQALIDAGAAVKVASSKKDEDKEPVKKSLGNMRRPELEAVAKEEGVEVTEDMKHNDIVAAIKAKRGE